MTQFLSRLLPLPLILALAACGLGSQTVVITGAETRAVTDTPRIVPARIGRIINDGSSIELVAADGTAYSGQLALQRAPAIVLLAAHAPIEGGQSALVGTITASNGATLECRFTLFNPARGADGGGTGACEGSGRQIRFVF